MHESSYRIWCSFPMYKWLVSDQSAGFHSAFHTQMYHLSSHCHMAKDKHEKCIDMYALCNLQLEIIIFGSIVYKAHANPIYYVN